MKMAGTLEQKSNHIIQKFWISRKKKTKGYLMHTWDFKKVDFKKVGFGGKLSLILWLKLQRP